MTNFTWFMEQFIRNCRKYHRSCWPQSADFMKYHRSCCSHSSHVWAELKDDKQVSIFIGELQPACFATFQQILGQILANLAACQHSGNLGHGRVVMVTRYTCVLKGNRGKIEVNMVDVKLSKARWNLIRLVDFQNQVQVLSCKAFHFHLNIYLF